MTDKKSKEAKPSSVKKAAPAKAEAAKKKAPAVKAVKAPTAKSAEPKTPKKTPAPKKAAAPVAAPAKAVENVAPVAPISVIATPAPVAASAPTPAAAKPIVPPVVPVAPKPSAPIENIRPVAPAPAAPAAKPIPAAPVAPPVVRPATPAPAPPVARPAAPAPVASVPPRPAAPQQPAPARPVAPVPPVVPVKSAPVVPPGLRKIELAMPVTVRDLAIALEQKPTEIIAKLIKMGTFATLNQFLQFEAVSKLAKEFGCEIEQPQELEHGLSKIHRDAIDESKLVSRSPIVTFMGHVDHGKTSLLDAIRKTKVVDTESGGITQHIGAYEVQTAKGAVTFLDTPGHEAFTAMRARGARCTDIVVLVIAADASIQPQTEEAIDHALAAEATVVVAINKCDLPNANVDRVKKDLAEHSLASEDWGGKTITVAVSAKTGQGIDQLLEMLLLEAELLELKANPQSPANGTVVEAELSRGSGPIATFLVQDGTLRVGDTVVCGNFHGKVRAMINDRGHRTQEAPPSSPVRVLGLSGVPLAGDTFYVVKDEAKARQFMNERQEKQRNKNLAGLSHITLDALYAGIKAGKIETLKLIVKADVQGSVEALKNILGQIPNNKVKLQIIHSGTGDVSHSDIMLAAASDAVVIGFHVSIAPDAHEIIKREGVDVRLYEIIYEAKAAIEKALEGLLEPEKKEIQIGVAEIRQVFKLTKSGLVAGSMVTKGKIVRNGLCRIFRKGVKVHEGKISTLKRFKNDAREVAEGFECGISVDGFTDYQAGDEIRVLEVELKAQTLQS